MVAKTPLIPPSVMVLELPVAVKVPLTGVAAGKYAAQPVLVTVSEPVVTVPPQPVANTIEPVVAAAVALLNSMASSCGSLAIIGLAPPVVPISKMLVFVNVPAEAIGRKAMFSPNSVNSTSTI